MLEDKSVITQIVQAVVCEKQLDNNYCNNKLDEYFELKNNRETPIIYAFKLFFIPYLFCLLLCLRYNFQYILNIIRTSICFCPPLNLTHLSLMFVFSKIRIQLHNDNRTSMFVIYIDSPPN